MVRALPRVSDAWCGVGVRGGRDFLAVAVETTVATEKLAKAAAARLPTWKQPRVWLALPQFPRNARGKTDTRALARQLGV